MLLLQIDHNQPNGAIKIKGCDVKLKCKIRVANYKYETNGVFLCIQLSFILRSKGSIQETYDKKISFALCHHTTTLLLNTTKFGFVLINRKKN